MKFFFAKMFVFMWKSKDHKKMILERKLKLILRLLNNLEINFHSWEMCTSMMHLEQRIGLIVVLLASLIDSELLAC